MVVGGAAQAHKSWCKDALAAPVISLRLLLSRILGCDVAALLTMRHLQTHVARSF